MNALKPLGIGITMEGERPAMVGRNSSSVPTGTT